MQVKKNAALLDDPEALWSALFTTFERVGAAALFGGLSESLLRVEFASGSRALLAALRHADRPMAWLCDMVWEVVTAPYVLDDATEFQLGLLRQSNDRDTKRVLDILRRLGAVTIEDETVALTDLGRSSMRTLLDEPEPGDPAYQLKITLVGQDNPPVWRRVLVPATIRLGGLHEVVQAAMGGGDRHRGGPRLSAIRCGTGGLPAGGLRRRARLPAVDRDPLRSWSRGPPVHARLVRVGQSRPVRPGTLRSG